MEKNMTTEKTVKFNLIILDESGSMNSLKKATISGCNETLNLIRSLEEKYADKQRNLVSIYVFQSGSDIPSRYLIKNRPITEVNDITETDYRPWGATPLLDAIGTTLTQLEMIAETHQDATGSVTIITDGYENDSREYSWEAIHKIIGRLKEKGWNINFIGANIDEKAVAARLNIDNTSRFEASEDGVKKSFANFRCCINKYEDDRMANETDMTYEEKIAYRKKRASGFFD